MIKSQPGKTEAEEGQGRSQGTPQGLAGTGKSTWPEQSGGQCVLRGPVQVPAVGRCLWMTL